MKEPTIHDRHEQALRALNCAIACMVAWPPSDANLGGAVYFTALALHRLAQADPNGHAATWAGKCLEQAKSGPIVIPAKEQP